MRWSSRRSKKLPLASRAARTSELHQDHWLPLKSKLQSNLFCHCRESGNQEIGMWEPVSGRRPESLSSNGRGHGGPFPPSQCATSLV